MGACDGWIVPLGEAAGCEERLIGGKAAKLAQLAQAGFRVPGGFCITTKACECFLEDQDLARLICMRLGHSMITARTIMDLSNRVKDAIYTIRREKGL